DESGASISSEEGEFSTHEKPLGGVAVLPTEGFGRKEKRDSKIEEKTNGIDNESDDEKENREVHGDRESQKSPERSPSDKKSKSKSPGGGFGSIFKSPKKSGGKADDERREGQGDADTNKMNVFKTGKDKKDKKSKDKGGQKDAKMAVEDVKGSEVGGGAKGDSKKKSGDGKLESLGVTREYVYNETEDEKEKKKKMKSKGFSYEKRGSKSEEELEESQRSPVRQNIGIAFNYSPTKKEAELVGQSKDGRSVGKDGRSVGKDGQVVAGDGESIGTEGQLLGKDGRLLSKDGQLLGKDGRLLGKDEQSVGKDGQLLGKDGKLLSKDGQSVGKDGQLLGKDGKLLSKDGQSVGKDGQLLGKDGKLLGKDGQLLGKDGKLLGKEGQSVGKDGKLVGKDGQSVGREGQLVGKDAQSFGKDGQQSVKDPQSASKDAQFISKEGSSSVKDSKTKDGRSGKDQRKSTASADSTSTAESDLLNKSADGEKHFKRGLGSLFKKKDKDSSSITSKDDGKDKPKKSKSDKKAKSDKNRRDSSSSSSSSDSSDGEGGSKGDKTKKKSKKEGLRDSSASGVAADKDHHKEGGLFGLKLKLGKDKKADGDVKTGKGAGSVDSSPAGKSDKAVSPGKVDKKKDKGGLFGFDSIGKKKKEDDKRKIEERALGKEVVSSTETLEGQGSPETELDKNKDKDKKKSGGIFASFERRPKTSPEKKDDKAKSKIPVADKRTDESPDKNKDKKSFFTFKPNAGKDKHGGDVESPKYSSTVSGSPSVIGDSPKSSSKVPSAVITEDPSAMFLNAERLGSPERDDRSFDLSAASTYGEEDRSNSFIEERSGPKIVKTTTKQSVVKNKGNVTHNIEEKVEDLSTGDFTVNTQTNTAESLEGLDPYVTATAVTTRTATTTEDLGTNAKTSQVEEKTVARTTTQTGTRQEKRVVTQEVRATSTIVSADPPMIERRDSLSSTSSDDSGTPIDDDRGVYYTNAGSITYQEPIVETEPILVTSPEFGDDSVTLTSTRDVPLVETAQAVVLPMGEKSFTLSGEVVSSQTITSKTRTVETVTYKTEKDGVVETRVEQKITIQSDGDPIDHDKALAEAIQEATAMNPDMQLFEQTREFFTGVNDLPKSNLCEKPLEMAVGGQ
ncbi:hypothetical protein GE061_008600, partial [Apolygus lucorum]